MSLLDLTFYLDEAAKKAASPVSKNCIFDSLTAKAKP